MLGIVYNRKVTLKWWKIIFMRKLDEDYRLSQHFL